MMRRYGGAIVGAGTAVALLIAWIVSAPRALPSFAEVRAQWRPSDTLLLDRNGDPLYERRIDLHGRRLAWTELDEISPALLRAVIASEDRRFYDHHGVDLRAIAGAMLHGGIGGRSRGASTITMQLAALIDPSIGRGGHRRTIARRWTKAQIVETDLNLITWRGELEGVAAATRVMFAKAPHGVTAGEAAVMAALLRAPNARRDTVVRRALALSSAMNTDAPSRDEIVSAAASAFGRHGSESARANLA